MRLPRKHSRKGNDMTLLATGDIYPKSTLTLVYLEMSMMKKFLSLEEIEGKTMTLWEITSSVDSEPTRLSPNFFVVQSNSVTIDSKSRSTTTCVKAKTSRHQWCIPVAPYCCQSLLPESKGIVSTSCLHLVPTTAPTTCYALILWEYVNSLLQEDVLYNS